MIGLGTLINTAAIIVGGLIGSFAGKLFRVANMLPAIIFAVIAAYLPWSF